jgi:hypothetical protein
LAQLQDLIGSIIIGGVILLMLLVFNGNIMESAGIQTFKTTVQGNLTAVTDIVENDFRKMGYRVAFPQDSAIVTAESTKIVFQGDIDNNGSVDLFQYTTDTVGVIKTPNPRDIAVRRKVTGPATPQDARMVLGITKFKLQYYDALDSLIKESPVLLPSKIRSIKITIAIENKEHLLDKRKGQRMSNVFQDTTYAAAYWERTIKPKNVR